MKYLSLFIFLMILQFGSSQTATFTVSIKTTPSACIRGSALLTISGGTGSDSVVWADGFLGTYHTGLDSGYHSFTIYDSLMNDTTISVYIEPLVCSMAAPESFSPNGDGINDFWNVSNTAYYEEYYIQVFSRWGQKVFDAKNPFEKWDGKSLGVPVPDGTYYYIIEFNDKYFNKQVKNGSIVLIR